MLLDDPFAGLDPTSATHIIRLLEALPSRIVVLGNHDLHLLAVAHGIRPQHRGDTLADVLAEDEAGNPALRLGAVLAGLEDVDDCRRQLLRSHRPRVSAAPAPAPPRPPARIPIPRARSRPARTSTEEHP